MFYRLALRPAWNPLREMERIQRQLEETDAPRQTVWPPVNVWQDENEAVVSADLPGVDPSAIEITIDDNVLTLSGRVEPAAPREKGGWVRFERPAGTFSRSVALPFRVDAEKVEARSANGVLTVTLPCAETEKVRRIEVKGE